MFLNDTLDGSSLLRDSEWGILGRDDSVSSLLSPLTVFIDRLALLGVNITVHIIWGYDYGILNLQLLQSIMVRCSLAAHVTSALDASITERNGQWRQSPVIIS